MDAMSENIKSSFRVFVVTPMTMMHLLSLGPVSYVVRFEISAVFSSLSVETSSLFRVRVVVLHRF